jgi:hypothetical protein
MLLDLFTPKAVGQIAIYFSAFLLQDSKHVNPQPTLQFQGSCSNYSRFGCQNNFSVGRKHLWFLRFADNTEFSKWLPGGSVVAASL